VDKSWNIKIADFGLSCGKLHSDQEVQVSLLWTAPVSYFAPLTLFIFLYSLLVIYFLFTYLFSNFKKKRAKKMHPKMKLKS
jgi:hypothetical protein